MNVFWAKFKLWIVGIGAALLAFGAMFLKTYQAGKDKVRQKQDRQTVKNAERAREIEHETEALGERDVWDRLRRGGWVRKHDKDG